MNKSVYINDICEFNLLSFSDYDSIYWGSEFCFSLLLQRKKSILDICNFVHENKKKLVLLTPPVIESDMALFASFADLVFEKTDGIEIVINDWGVFRHLQNAYSDRTNNSYNLGRLLTKSKCDPDYCKQQNYQNKTNVSYRDLLVDLGFKRLELNNGAEDYHFDKRFNYSVYYPYQCVSTALGCPAKNVMSSKSPDFPTKCNFECQKFTLKRNIEKGQFLYKGNSVFHHLNLAENLEKSCIDRTVFFPSTSLGSWQ